MRFLLTVALLSFSAIASSNTLEISNLEPYETWLEVQFSNSDTTENIKDLDLYGRSSIYQSPSFGPEDNVDTQTYKEKQSTERITLATAFAKRNQNTVTPIIGVNYEKVETSSVTSFTNNNGHFYTAEIFLGADYTLEGNHSLTSLYAYQYSSKAFYLRDESSLEFSLNSKGVTTAFDNQLSLLAVRKHNSGSIKGGHKLTLRNTTLYHFNELIEFDFMFGASYISNKEGPFLYPINGSIIAASLQEDPYSNTNSSESAAYEEVFENGPPTASPFNPFIEYDYQLAYGASAYFNPTQTVSIKLFSTQSRIKGKVSGENRFDETNTHIGLSLISRF